MAFRYCRTIRFHETDAAGVVYFANVLAFCHEAYEAALQESAIDFSQFFSASNRSPVPIAHAEADYFMPLFVGDRIAITLVPKQLTLYSYEIRYTLHYQSPLVDRSPNQSKDQSKSNRPIATALTRHVCIDKATRKKHPIDEHLTDWIADLAAPAMPND